MPTYATQQDCINYIEGLAIDDQAAFDRLIERAERDLDQEFYLRFSTVSSTGRKIDLTTLTTGEASALRDATCAQVQYRIAMGEDFFVEPTYSSVSGPDFNTQGRAPRVGPQALRELRSQGLIFATARARA